MNAYEFIIKMKDMASSNLQRIASSLGMASNQANGFERSMRNAESTSGSATSKMASGFGQLIGIVGAVGLAMAVMAGARSIFNMGVEMEQTNIKFEVLLGSTAKATAMLKDLNSYADATPYENSGVIKGAETMLAFGIAHEKVMPNIKMLGDVAMGNQEKLSSLSLSFSQVMATGRLMGQDLNQMIGQGFNPLQIISENTGISMGVLKQKMEEGVISAGMVEEAFRLTTSEGGRYFNMSKELAESAGGKFNTMMGAFKNTVGRIGMAFAEWIKPLFDIGTSVIENIIPFGKAVLGIIKYLTDIKPLMFFFAAAVASLGINFVLTNAAFWFFSAQFYAYSAAVWIATQATAAFNFVMNMNPIAKVALVIGILITAVMALWNHWEGLRGVIMGTWEVMKGFGSAIKNYVINRFSELLAGVQGIGSALSAFFKGDFTKAFEIGKKAAGDLLGVNSKKQFFDDGLKAVKTFNTGYAKGLKMNAPEVALKATSPKTTKDPFKQKESSLFAGLKDGTGKGAGGKDKKDKSNADNIVSGGNKMTSITINIQKLQDDTKIYVSSTEQGLNSLGDKVQEMILRAMNSVNQMQTN